MKQVWRLWEIGSDFIGFGFRIFHLACYTGFLGWMWNGGSVHIAKIIQHLLNAHKQMLISIILHVRTYGMLPINAWDFSLLKMKSIGSTFNNFFFLVRLNDKWPHLFKKGEEWNKKNLLYFIVPVRFLSQKLSRHKKETCNYDVIVSARDTKITQLRNGYSRSYPLSASRLNRVKD